MHVSTPAAKVEAIVRLANELFRTDIERAISLYEEALALATDPTCPDPLGQASCLLGLSRTIMVRGQYEQSLVHALDALTIYRQLETLPDQIGATRHLGLIYQVLGDYAIGLEYQFQALRLATQLNDRSAQSGIALAIGMCYSEMGRSADALPFYDQALVLCRELGDRQAEGRILNSYCVDATNIGAYAQALEHGQSSAEIFALTGDSYGQGVALGSIGETYVAAGQYSEAIPVLRESLDLLRMRAPTLTSHEAIAITYQLGLAHLKLGELAPANLYLEAATTRAAETGIATLEYQCYEQLAELCELQGNLGQALAHYRRFHALKEQLFNEASDRKFKKLEVLHRTQQALDEAERQKRLREEDRRYFEHLAQLQRTFFNAATHDLKNPLSALGLAINLIEQSIAPGNIETHELLMLMKRGISRMHQLIANFLDLARLETGRALNIQAVSIVDLIDAAVYDHQLTASQKDLSLSVQIELEQASIECDPEQISRVLDNLIGNAIKYTPAGGQVHITAKQESAMITITITDTGLGIPAADVAHIFDPFYRVDAASHASFEGTGLGLAIVKAIIEQHAGTILVESKEGLGSMFQVSLPQRHTHG